MKQFLAGVGFMSLAFVMTGCHSRRVAAATPPAAPPPAQAQAADQEPSLRGKDYKDVPGLETVHFDFDKTQIRPGDTGILKKNYDLIMQHAEWQFLIEGHCDVRGTEAYNLGLGQRRAAAVRRYYLALGVDGRRIATISYGAEKPLCTDSNEACWAENRRGATKARIWDEAQKP